MITCLHLYNRIEVTKRLLENFWGTLSLRKSSTWSVKNARKTFGLNGSSFCKSSY